MKRTVVTSALVLVVVTGLVIAAAVGMLRPDGGEAERAVSVDKRPACPYSQVGGVELECLGGSNNDRVPAEDAVTVVNLWAWWCQPCREELPAVDELRARRPDWTVVGVHADRDAAAGAALLNELGVDLPSYHDGTGAFAGSLDLPGVVPITVVFRGQNKIAVFTEPFAGADDIERAVDSAVGKETG